MQIDLNGAGPAAGGLIKDTTTQTFMADVIEASKDVPVLVDFWAPWCGPCKQLTPVLEKVVRDARGAVKLVKMNIDEYPEIAGQMGVQSIPAVFAFKNGRPVDGFMGAQGETQIRAFIQKLAGPVGNPVEDMLAAGDEALGAGDVNAAAQAYSTVLQQEQENLHAIGGLIRCMVKAGDLERARQTLSIVPAGKEGDSHIAGAVAELELAEMAGKLEDLADLEAAIITDPNNHQARFDMALVLNARGKREAAARELIEIVRRNRAWNDEAARVQLLKFFDAWGPMDEATVAGRRALSSVLFS
ncbi:MAG: thioredoxin [Flavobacteriaceae bacterium]